MTGQHRSTPLRQLLSRWEILFFLAVDILLGLQVFLFNFNI